MDNNIVFIGDWTRERILGSGSFGTVVLWKHKRTEERLALKTFKWGDEITAKQRERWAKEVEMMQDCKNPNIVGTKELPSEFIAGLEPVNPFGLPILCMEYCSGGDLRQLLNRPESCSGLKETQVRQILSDICNAMQFLHHNKITHRDLKPENIVLHVMDSNGSGEAEKVTYKLTDLGYAKEIDSKSVCASFVGTLQYLAPELLYSKTYSNSVDFWSFGLLAFEIICGVRPFLPFMAHVEWMMYVKKKMHEHICVYEAFHTGDDKEYSKEIFSENHVSNAFKSLIEKWLQVALEWDPKLRGRDAPSKVSFRLPSEQQSDASRIVIFDLLEKVLSTKIIKIFSVTTLSCLSYEIDDSTTISTLKNWIYKDIKIPVPEQVLISQTTYTDIGSGDLVSRYWNENAKFMIFLFSKTCLVNKDAEPIVPKSVQRILAQPNALYNFKNSLTLYRHGVFLVMSQMDMYDGLINGLFTRAESLKNESRQLLVKQNDVDKSIGKLVAQDESLKKMVDTGKKHIQNMRDNGTATNYLGGFQENFDDADDLADKITKLQLAWSQLSVRLTSAGRRCTEVLSVDLNNFITKYNYQALFTNVIKTYITYKRSEFQSEHRVKEKKCTDIMKICYDCLKFRSNILSEIQHQPFMLKLNDLSIEIAKISDIITNTILTVENLNSKMSKVTDDLANCVWTTLSILASDADNLADLPYSVVSFQKRDFKIGQSVSNHCIKVANTVSENAKIASLLKESLSLRNNQIDLSRKLNEQKNILDRTMFDFSFLDEK